MTEKVDNEAAQARVMEVFPGAVHSEVFPRLHRIQCADSGPYLFGKTETAAWRSAAKWIEKNLHVDETRLTPKQRVLAIKACNRHAKSQTK